MAYLYVFIDESGNYDFSSSGTANLILTSLITEGIRPGIVELYELKHKLIDLGTDLEYFHATEDRQAVRNEVFDIIHNLSNIRVDSVVVDKRKTGPSIRSIEKFYPIMLENLLKYPFDPRGIDVSKYDRVFIFCDRASGTKRQKQALLAGIKTYLSRHLKGIPYHVCMHSSASHPYLQIVDYISWAIYVAQERGENRPLDQVRHLVKSQFPIFERETTIWY